MNLAPPLPPCIVVQGWEEACAAVAPRLPVTLLSAPSAAAFAGIGWWRALVDGVAAETGTEPADLLDCGSSAGLAVQALRNRCRQLVLDPFLPAWPDVAERAQRLGSVLLAERPPALELGGLRLATPVAAARIEAWLRRDSSASVG